MAPVSGRSEERGGMTNVSECGLGKKELAATLKEKQYKCLGCKLDTGAAISMMPEVFVTEKCKKKDTKRNTKYRSA